MVSWVVQDVEFSIFSRGRDWNDKKEKNDNHNNNDNNNKQQKHCWPVSALSPRPTSRWRVTR